jgi:hypothetical protein
MHHHLSALHLVTVFVGVLLIGTLWRAGAVNLAASESSTPRKIGQAMLVQY